MPFTVTLTTLSGVLILEPTVFGDDRGFFLESFNERDFLSATGLCVHFVQDNHSQSKKGVLRGLHYQLDQPQGKLVRVTQGEVFDVSVNLQRNHPEFGRWTGIHLSAQNKKQLWIPPGFAHGFLVLSEHADFMYKATDYYSQEAERCLLWNDPALAITWPLAALDGIAPTLTPKDLAGSLLATADVFV
ncbi:RfbC dTDP-4-dehydrorhamnose 3,5-epimerase and related enzymes [Burkholderiaceae bacterium]